MKIESQAMQEVHAIRMSIREQTKNMTAEELVAFYIASTKDTIKEYGMIVGTPKKQIRQNGIWQSKKTSP